jgi:hypothetical protein
MTSDTTRPLISEHAKARPKQIKASESMGGAAEPAPGNQRVEGEAPAIPPGLTAIGPADGDTVLTDLSIYDFEEGHTVQLPDGTIIISEDDDAR